MLRAQVLDRLERADRPAELLPGPRVLGRGLAAPGRDPARLGGGQRRRQVGHQPRVDAAEHPGRPARVTSVSVTSPSAREKSTGACARDLARPAASARQQEPGLGPVAGLRAEQQVRGVARAEHQAGGAADTRSPPSGAAVAASPVSRAARPRRTPSPAPISPSSAGRRRRRQLTWPARARRAASAAPGRRERGGELLGHDGDIGDGAAGAAELARQRDREHAKLGQRRPSSPSRPVRLSPRPSACRRAGRSASSPRTAAIVPARFAHWPTDSAIATLLGCDRDGQLLLPGCSGAHKTRTRYTFNGYRDASLSRHASVNSRDMVQAGQGSLRAADELGRRGRSGMPGQRGERRRREAQMAAAKTGRASHAGRSGRGGAWLGGAARAAQADTRRDAGAGVQGRLRRRPDARGRRAGRRRARHAVPVLPLQDPPAGLRPGQGVRAHQGEAGQARRSPGTRQYDRMHLRAEQGDQEHAARAAADRGDDQGVHVRRSERGHRGQRRRRADGADADRAPCTTASRPRTSGRSRG